MNDQAIEKEIQAKGLTAARVTLAQIDALMARVTYVGGQVGETTSTVVHAFLDGRDTPPQSAITTNLRLSSTTWHTDVVHRRWPFETATIAARAVATTNMLCFVTECAT